MAKKVAAVIAQQTSDIAELSKSVKGLVAAVSKMEGNLNSKTGNSAGKKE